MPNHGAIAIKQTSWTSEGPILSDIRRRVFIHEQGVAESEEWDGQDDSARHFLALTPSGEAVGTARVIVEETNGDETARYHIGRVAVLPPWRRRGVGTALMRAVIHWCQQDAAIRPPHIHLNAQSERLAFYQRLGFSAQGAIFMDAGIPHQAMFLKPIKA